MSKDIIKIDVKDKLASAVSHKGAEIITSHSGVINPKAVLLLDYSGSMTDLVGVGNGKKRQAYKILDEQVAKFPQIAKVYFNSSTTTIKPDEPEGGTDLVSALQYVKKDYNKVILITDGRPDGLHAYDAKDAKQHARQRYKNLVSNIQIDCVYIGNDDVIAQAFLKELSLLGIPGGQYSHTDIKFVENKISNLLAEKAGSDGTIKL